MNTHPIGSSHNNFGTDTSEPYSTVVLTNQRGTRSVESRKQSMTGDYNSMFSSRDLGSLPFENSSRSVRPLPFFKETYKGPMNQAGDLKILNAESHPDGRDRAGRRRQEAKEMLPLGVVDNGRLELNRKTPMDAETYDSGPRRKKPRIERQSPDDEEETKGKARGRPRVSPKDETAADVSVSSIWFGF